MNSRNFFRQIKLKKILRRHRRTYQYWQEVIQRYEAGEIKKWHFEPKNLGHDKIIWQYWGQGVEDWEALPPTVRTCFESVNRYHGDYTVIRLSDETIQEYITLPPFVYEKLRDNKVFTRTFLSDLLRVALISTYGGVWLDATILLTGELPQEFTNGDYFMFQRSDEEQNKDYWERIFIYYYCWHPDFKVKVLNSIIFGQQGSQMLRSITDLLLFFWQYEEKISEYFFFQILYEALVEGPLSELRCPIINDCYPHILQAHIFDQKPPYSVEDTLRLSTIHKLTYFNSKQIDHLQELLNKGASK